jgi:hypothetical protein
MRTLNKPLFNMLFLVLLVGAMSSCGDEDNENKGKDAVTEPKPKDKSNTISLQDQLLLETNICNDFILNSANRDLSCIVDTHFIALQKDSSLSNGFILMAKYLDDEIQTLRTYIFKRMEDDKLVMINDFDAIFLSSDTISSGYCDILLRFVEPYKEDKFYYNCWFTYSPELSKYVYRDCHSINRESKNGNYGDVYEAEKAMPHYREQTDREVFELLSDYELIH